MKEFIATLCTCAAMTTLAPVEQPKAKPKVAEAAPTELKDGIYICRGSEGAGKTYKGSVTVRKVEQNYLFIYQVGLNTFRGTGVVDDNKIIVGWSMGTVNGVTIYRVGDKISGRWATLGSGAGTEELALVESLSD